MGYGAGFSPGTNQFVLPIPGPGAPTSTTINGVPSGTDFVRAFTRHNCPGKISAPSNEITVVVP